MAVRVDYASAQDWSAGSVIVSLVKRALKRTLKVSGTVNIVVFCLKCLFRLAKVVILSKDTLVTARILFICLIEIIIGKLDVHKD
jgi:hypothetical protein